MALPPCVASAMASYCFKPCEYIGKCIDKGCECGCKACDAACSAPCQAFGKCCCPPDKPSPIFLTYSLAVCGIPAVLALLGMTSAKDCANNVKVFLGVMLALNLALIAFAIYLYHRFSQPYSGVDQEGRAESTVTMRASNMFCYDPVVFLYMLVLAGGAVLSILGSTWVKSGCSGSNATAVTSFFWIYIFGGIVVIMLSLCVECGRSQVSCLPPARLHAHRGCKACACRENNAHSCARVRTALCWRRHQR